MIKTYPLIITLITCVLSYSSIAQSVSLPQASLSAMPLGTVENGGNAIATIHITESSGTAVPSQAFNEPNVSISIDLQYIELRDANVNAITGSGMDYFTAIYNENNNILLLEQKDIIPGDWSGAIDFPIAVIQNSTQAQSFNGFNANISAIDAGTDAEGNASIFTYTSEDVLATNNAAALNFKVSPNPSKGIYNILLNERKEAVVELFDLTGKLILTKKYNATDIITLHIDALAAAVYMLKVTAGDATHTVRIIKE